jgi:hypothetical protein
MVEYSFEEEKHKFLDEIYGDGRGYEGILEKYSFQIRSNKELVLLAVRDDGSNLEYASKELQRDKDVVYIASINWFYAFDNAHEDLKRDEEFVLEVIIANPYIIEYICSELLDNEYFLYKVTKKCKFVRSEKMMSHISKRIFNELSKNPDYLDDFSSLPVNYKPAKRS